MRMIHLRPRHAMTYTHQLCRGVGLLNDFYYVGALLAAGITLGTSQWESTWAWRAPSLLQGIFSALCILILPFM